MVELVELEVPSVVMVMAADKVESGMLAGAAAGAAGTEEEPFAVDQIVDLLSLLVLHYSYFWIATNRPEQQHKVQTKCPRL